MPPTRQPGADDATAQEYIKKESLWRQESKKKESVTPVFWTETALQAVNSSELQHCTGTDFVGCFFRCKPRHRTHAIHMVHWKPRKIFFYFSIFLIN
jgi:hypothetical protein